MDTDATTTTSPTAARVRTMSMSMNNMGTGTGLRSVSEGMKTTTSRSSSRRPNTIRSIPRDSRD